MLDGIEAYNRDDCVSTRELRDWLLTCGRKAFPGPGWSGMRRTRSGRPGASGGSRCRGDPHAAGGGCPRGGAALPGTGAHLAAFHRREQKPGWWAMFDRQNRAPRS
ncbi:hypothetical protein [Roseomonas sp. FDAARGOS_362]|uniref:hypothetical protein n=1 Tax=Roseomonas sp. FDAARGOS_362 TaxID=2018065 RepID=UPI00351176E3